MKHYVVLSIFIACWISPIPAFLQNWTKVQQWGGSGIETCSGVVASPDGSIFIAGSFQHQIRFGNQALSSIGESDIFLCKFYANGEVAWAKRAGSQSADEVTNIILDNEGNLIITGIYWQQGDFDTIQLTTSGNPKAIYLVKYNTNGQALWGKSLSGGDLKSATEVACDHDGNIFLSGFFSDRLQLDDTTLLAQGKTDLLVAKFNSAGNLQWALRQGKTADTRGTALGIFSNGDLVVAGFFNDTTQIADTILTSNTADQDIFLARINGNGVPLWAKKAGGVFDSDATALAIDAFDNLYLTGYFVGVIRLNPQLSIQSSSGNADFFILKYQSNGVPIDARALGGTLLQQATDLVLQDSLLVISGFYQGDMTLDDFTLTSAKNTTSGFAAAFEPNLICRWIKNIASDQALFATRIASHANNKLYIAGSFIGKTIFDSKSLTATGNYDLFLASIENSITPSKFLKKENFFRVFPNPTKGQVFVKTDIQKFRIWVTDLNGKMVFSGTNVLVLDFSHLPKGTYFITFQTDFANQTQQLIWQ